MKLLYFLCVAGLALGCETENEKGPQTVFQGKWRWLKTDGVGIAGPYESDSSTVGYSIRYEFGFSEIQMYRNDAKVEHYSYSFTVSEKPEDQRLTFKTNNPEAEVSYLWEIKTVNSKKRLILRNVEPCCDNTFEQHFEMVEGTGLNGNK